MEIAYLDKTIIDVNEDSSDTPSAIGFENENDRVSEQVISRVSSIIESDKYGNKPSAKFYEGLTEIARCIHAMAYPNRDEVANTDFDFRNTICLSHLACGAGKTTTLIETVKFLMADPLYDEVGFIIFLSKLSEIADITEKIGLSEKDFSVVVHPNAEVFNKGNPVKKDARVMFTTQQMLSRQSLGGNGRRKFADISDYFYKGRARQVRVWDEACLPANNLVIERSKLNGALPSLEKIDKGLHRAIDKFCVELYGKNDNDSIEMPDLSEFGFTSQEVLARIKHEDFREPMQALFSAQGLVARVRKKEGIMTIQYEEALPSDIAPMLILDASGRERTTYEYWFKGRKNIHKLKSPGKSYKGLTVHHWNRGGGKAAHSNRDKKYKEIALGVARGMNRISRDEAILAVVHKPGYYQPDMEKEIRGLFKPDRESYFTTWGKHSSSNEWRECKHVFLVGLQYYNNPSYEAMAKGALGESVETPATKDMIDYIMKGEPRRVYRRLFGLSYAAMRVSSSMA